MSMQLDAWVWLGLELSDVLQKTLAQELRGHGVSIVLRNEGDVAVRSCASLGQLRRALAINQRS